MDSKALIHILKNAFLWGILKIYSILVGFKESFIKYDLGNETRKLGLKYVDGGCHIAIYNNRILINTDQGAQYHVHPTCIFGQKILSNKNCMRVIVIESLLQKGLQFDQQFTMNVHFNIENNMYQLQTRLTL